MVSMLSRSFVFVFAFLVGIFTVVQYGFLGAETSPLVSFKLTQPDFQLTPWLYVLYAHAATAVIALIAGPFQVFRKPSAAGVRQHRLLGYVYAFSVTLSGLVSVYLSFFTTGGWISGIGLLVLDVLWVSSTWIGVGKIAAKNLKAHKRWMLRSYALTFAAVTLRLLLVPLEMVTGGRVELSFRIVAWASWLINLLVVELVIRSGRAATRTPEEVQVRLD